MYDFYYENEVVFSYSDFDIYDHIFPRRILQVLQDTAGEHALKLHVGYDDFIPKDLIWVLIRMNYEVLDDIKPFKTYVVKTHPVRPKLLNIQRDFEIREKGTGKVCVIATSLWAIVNIKTRRLVRPTKDTGFIFSDEFEYIDEDKNHILPKSISKEISLNKPNLVQKVLFSYLDHNLHMNNTYYADLIIEVLGLENKDLITSMQINYEKECTYNDVLYIYKENVVEDSISFIKVIGKKKDLDICFVSKVVINYGK